MLADATAKACASAICPHCLRSALSAIRQGAVVVTVTAPPVSEPEVAFNVIVPAVVVARTMAISLPLNAACDVPLYESWFIEFPASRPTSAPGPLIVKAIVLLAWGTTTPCASTMSTSTYAKSLDQP